ncbi:hypothetical protein [Halovivax gelatinilyticus]|uniref:hypothetical protein n=1 Tax=Halovivax gelatinilyticus TaxID=2961597 RepID=UPI0020CA70A6|nr:hypothetical protein [Halovivax gelatinilyticus]
MVDLLLVALVAIPVFVQLLLAGFTYYDAGDVGMDRRKWTAIVGLIPVYGLILYILTRSEQSYDPSTDPHRERAFEIHPSRQGEGLGPADERPAATRGGDGPETHAGDDYWENRSYADEDDAWDDVDVDWEGDDEN